MSLPIRIAQEGAGRYDSADPEEGKIDIEPFMESALEEIVECLLNFGVYPKPRRNWSTRSEGAFFPQRVLFDLYDHIDEIIDIADMREFMILAINDRSRTGLYESGFEHARDRHEDTIKNWLIAELTGSELVADRAEDLANEAREK